MKLDLRLSMSRIETQAKNVGEDVQSCGQIAKGEKKETERQF